MNDVVNELKAKKNKPLDDLEKDYTKLDNSDLEDWQKRQIKAVYFGRLMRIRYE